MPLYVQTLLPMAPSEAERYKERSAAERFSSSLKDGFDAKNVMIKGVEKVKTHIIFGVVFLFVEQTFKIIKYYIVK